MNEKLYKEARARARASYEEKNDIVTVQMRVPRSERDLWRSAAEKSGLTFTAYIRKLILNDMRKL